MRFILIFTLIFTAIQVNAQRFSWGIPIKHDKLEFSGKASIQTYLLSENENGLVRLRVQKGDVIGNSDIIIEKLNAAFELQKTIDVFNGGMTNHYLEEIIVGKDKFYVFSSIPGTDKSNTLVVQPYDFEGEPIGEERTLDVITKTKAIARGEFHIAASENRYHFTVVTIPIYEKKVNETIKVKTFDAAFKETFNKDITLEYARKRFIFNTPYIMNDGTMFLYKHIKVKKVGIMREMYILDKAKGTLVSNKLKLSNGNDLVMIDNTMLENSKGNFIYAGLFKKEGKMQAAKGVFYLEYDKTGKLINEVAHEFKDAPKLGFTGLKIKKVELLPNDEVLFLAHQFSESAIAQSANSTDRVYGYTADNIFVARLNNKDLVWSQIIERQRLETKSDRGRLLDFVWMYDEEGDNLVLLYNDLESRYHKLLRAGNYKIPMFAYIGQDGEYSTKPLFDVGLGKYDDNYTFCTDEFYQIDNYLIVKCSNNIDFKIGRFSL